MRHFLIQSITFILFLTFSQSVASIVNTEGDTLKLAPLTNFVFKEHPEMDLNAWADSAYRISGIPVNDNCLDAILLNVNAPCTTGSNRESTTEAGENFGCQGTSMRKSVWYYFIASSSKMFVEVEKTASYSCHLGSAVWEYGCLPVNNPISCEDPADGPSLNIHRLTTLIPGQRYMVQVTYQTSAICGGATNPMAGADFCIRVGETQDCSSCQAPCGSVCAFSSVPTSIQVQSVCSRYDLNSRMNSGDSRTQCFSLTSPTSTFNLQMIINSFGCSSGNVTAFNWVLKPVGCGSIVDSGTLTKLTANGLTPGMGYILCYSWTAACQHNSVYPYISYSQPLPVEMLSFTAKRETKFIDLLWTTGTELNNDHYDIERSENGFEYYSIGRISGKAFSSSNTNYEFRDEDPLNGSNYYRLKQIDIDGQFKYYGPIIEKFRSDIQFEIKPNPVSEVLFLSGLNSLEGDIKCSVIDVTGRIRIEKYFSMSNKELIPDMDVADLKPGFYILRLVNDRISVSERFIKK